MSNKLKDKVKTESKTENTPKYGLETTKSEQRGNNKWKKNKYPKSNKGGKDAMSYRRGKMFNDISYYTKNPEILKAFANIPFNFIVGGKLNTKRNQYIGTILSYIVDWVANPTSTNESDTRQTILDQIKTIIYTEMRKANAGSTNNIEPIDVMVSNLMASIDIYCNAVYLSRFFPISNSFSWKNREIPRELFKHCGIDYDDFIANQANYRGRYDVLVAYAKTIRTLKDFPFLNAAFSEFANVFKDEDTDTGREQLYLAVKAFHHIYDPIGTSEHPGGTVRLMTFKDLDPSSSSNNIIVTAKNPTSPYKFDYLLRIFETQISVLINDSDFNLIQADIAKAFGEQSGYIEVAPVSSDVGPIDIKHSGEFLTMLHNGTFLHLPGYSNAGRWVMVHNSYVNTIYQKPSSVTSEARFGFENHVYYSAPQNTTNLENMVVAGTSSVNNNFTGGLVNTNIDNPSPEDLIIFTRFKTIMRKDQATRVPSDFRVAGDGDDAAYFRTEGSSNFICFGNLVSCLGYSIDGTVRSEPLEWDNVPQLELNMIGPVRGLLLQFEMSPMQFIYGYEGSYYPAFQANNIKGLDGTEIASINEAAFMSLWNLPAKTNI